MEPYTYTPVQDWESALDNKGKTRPFAVHLNYSANSFFRGHVAAINDLAYVPVSGGLPVELAPEQHELLKTDFSEVKSILTQMVMAIQGRYAAAGRHLSWAEVQKILAKEVDNIESYYSAPVGRVSDENLPKITAWIEEVLDKTTSSTHERHSRYFQMVGGYNTSWEDAPRKLYGTYRRAAWLACVLKRTESSEPCDMSKATGIRLLAERGIVPQEHADKCNPNLALPLIAFFQQEQLLAGLDFVYAFQKTYPDKFTADKDEAVTNYYGALVKHPHGTKPVLGSRSLHCYNSGRHRTGNVSQYRQTPVGRFYPRPSEETIGQLRKVFGKIISRMQRDVRKAER